jgi:hypothetical protein
MATDAGVLSRGAIDAYKHQGQDVSGGLRSCRVAGCAPCARQNAHA